MRIFSISFVIFFGFIELVKCDQEKKKQVKVKIIEEPAQNQFAASQFEALYGEQQRRRSANDFTDESGLKASHKPAPFSGPSQLEEVNGLCFDYSSNDYKWVVCPFHNVTQFELNLRYNPYKGILGIWYEWEIVDNKFVSMVMLNGDDCGSVGKRKTKVYFKCDENLNETKIGEVSEPETCNYKVTLLSPLVCEQFNKDNEMQTNSMSVYPYLNGELRYKWDHVYTEYSNRFITEKAYQLSLRVLFEKAGFYRSNEDEKTLKIVDEIAANSTAISPKDEQKQNVGFRPTFKDTTANIEDELAECKRENQRLKDIIDRLNTATNITI